MLEIRRLKTIEVAIEDTETELSWQSRIYCRSKFCRRVHRHMGIASSRSRQLVLIFILDAVGLASLLG
jgi:hypothetical protein